MRGSLRESHDGARRTPHVLSAFRWRQCKHGLRLLLLLDGLEYSRFGGGASALNRHEDASLHRLQIEFIIAGALSAGGDLPPDELLPLIIELHSFAGDRRGTLFEGRG